MIRESRSRLTIVGKREAILDGQAISYIIKRSPKAKYVRLDVRSETGLTVVVPKSYKSERVPELLREKRRWILDFLDVLSYRITNPGPEENLYLPFFQGNLRYDKGQKGILWVRARKPAKI